ncbi:MAG: zf-HC2 domain-containing protein [Jiangellaceae bacterium]
MTWHIPEQAVGAYVSGRIADADAWSVEAHLVACAACQEAVAAATDGTELAASAERAWLAVGHRLAPQGAVYAGTGRRRLRMMLASGPSARGAWLLAIAVVLALATVLDWTVPLIDVARHGGPIPWIAVLGPLLPVLGVAASYGSGLDDAHEIIASTPAGGLRLVLVRTAAVLAVSVPAALVAGVGSDAGSPVVWLLACLALTLVTLALGSVTGLVRAAVLVGVAWLVAVGAPAATQSVPVLLEADAVAGWLAVSAVAAAVVVARRDSFNVMPLSTCSRIEA